MNLPLAMTERSEAADDQRDPVLFATLLRESRSRVFGYLLALAQNLSDAEDLYQQTALVLWEKFHEYESGSDFGAWATSVAHYNAVNFLRRQSRRRMLFSGAVLARLVETQATISDREISARSEALKRCLETLSSNHRRLLMLRYHGEYSMAQIAKQESRSVGALYVALSRIRKALLSCIEQRIASEAVIMSPRDLFVEICDLAMRASDDRLSGAQRKRLNDLLESSDDACRALLFCGIMDAELAVHASEEAAQDRALEAITSDASASAYTPTKRKRTRRRSSLFSRWFPRAALACLLLGVAAPFFISREVVPVVPSTPAVNLVKRVPQPVGSLKSAPEAKFVGLSPRVGDSFTEGDVIVLDSGEAHVSLASGAEFVLKGPADLKFDSANHVELRRGVLTAHVAAWGSGFTVDTSAMRVVDLGTRFSVSASTQDVETHVLQGQVRVQPLASTVSGRRSVLLAQGEGIRVDSGADEPVRFVAQKERVPETTEKFRPFKPVALFNSGIALAEGDEDPHWHITRGPFGASFKKPQFGVVCTPDPRYATNEPQRSQWLSFAKDVRPGGLAKSVYTFETTFDLTGFDPSTVIVAAQMVADNGVHAVRINGQSVPIVPWDDNDFAQTFNSDQFRLVEIRDGFVPGKNKIEIDVWNGTYRMAGSEHDPNPMALRVEFQGFGRLNIHRETAAGVSANLVTGPNGAT